jgi:O-antigen ligase
MLPVFALISNKKIVINKFFIVFTVLWFCFLVLTTVGVLRFENIYSKGIYGFWLIVMSWNILLFFVKKDSDNFFPIVWLFLLYLSSFMSALGDGYGVYFTNNQFVENGKLGFSLMSVFYNPNGYGQFLSLSLPFLLLGLENSRQKSKKGMSFIYYFSIISGLFLVMFTFSRLSIFSYYLGCLIYFALRPFFLKNKKRGFLPLILVVFIACLGFLCAKENELLMNKLSGFGGDTSSQIRKNIHIVAFKNIFPEAPFWGIGPGKFESMVDNYNHDRLPLFGITNPHSFLIEIVVEYGVVSLCLILIVFLFNCYLVYLKRKFLGALSLILVVFLVVFIATSFAESRNLRGVSLPLFFSGFSYTMSLLKNKRRVA